MASDGEMVDRVARAIYASGQFVKPWEKCSWQHACRRQARAAIAAMREPTEAMLNAAAIAKECESKWLCMIDAALANPSEIPNSPESAG
jgi:hypothetical protein